MSRSKAMLVFIFVLLLCAGCSAQNVNSEIDTLYLTNCRVIDGTGVTPVDNAVIAIKGSVLSAVGTKDSIAIPEGAKVIDLEGATVMPGFINAHVHRAYNEQNIENWLQGGVTTVRDEAPLATKNFLSERDRLNKDPAHSRIVSATPILSVPGGYAQDFFTSADTASKKVSQYIKQGVDIIKFSIEDDLQGRTWEMPTYEEVKAIVDTAHRSGKKVSVHISHERNLKWAIDAGVDDIAHMVVEPISKETAELIVQKGIYWVPSLELWNGVSKDYSLNWIDVAIKNLSTFYKAGGKVALGTDFAGYTCSFDSGFPVTEVNLMKQAGMTPMDIIVAGTKNAAHVCGLENILGTIEVGKIADLLVVIGDPLAENPQLTGRMVIHGGKIVVDNANAS